MKKDDFLVAGALWLIAVLVTGVHVATDQAIAEAMSTGNADLLAAAQNWQWALMGLEILMIIAIVFGIKRDISRNACTVSAD